MVRHAIVKHTWIRIKMVFESGIVFFWLFVLGFISWLHIKSLCNRVSPCRLIRCGVIVILTQCTVWWISYSLLFSSKWQIPLLLDSSFESVFIIQQWIPLKFWRISFFVCWHFVPWRLGSEVWNFAPIIVWRFPVPVPGFFVVDDRLCFGGIPPLGISLVLWDWWRITYFSQMSLVVSGWFHLDGIPLKVKSLSFFLHSFRWWWQNIIWQVSFF